MHFSIHFTVLFQKLHSCDMKTQHGERGGLVKEPWSPEREVGGSILTKGAVLCHWARHIYSPKVFVIPRKRCLCPDMTENVFTLTSNKNESKPQHIKMEILNERLYLSSFYWNLVQLNFIDQGRTHQVWVLLLLLWNNALLSISSWWWYSMCMAKTITAQLWVFILERILK